MKNKLLDKIKYIVRQLTEYPLVEVNDQLAIKPPKQKITPIVHQTWIDNKFGKTHAKSLLDFRNLNKNLSFFIYSDTAIDEYMKKYWGKKKKYMIFLKMR